MPSIKEAFPTPAERLEQEERKRLAYWLGVATVWAPVLTAALVIYWLA